ncbi:MAG: hypothetical protein Q8P67_25455 [archaeon]|nr:hypothetical protein [archaeon]
MVTQLFKHERIITTAAKVCSVLFFLRPQNNSS